MYFLIGIISKSVMQILFHKESIPVFAFLGFFKISGRPLPWGLLLIKLRLQSSHTYTWTPLLNGAKYTHQLYKFIIYVFKKFQISNTYIEQWSKTKSVRQTPSPLPSIFITGQECGHGVVSGLYDPSLYEPIPVKLTPKIARACSYGSLVGERNAYCAERPIPQPFLPTPHTKTPITHIQSIAQPRSQLCTCLSKR